MKKGLIKILSVCFILSIILSGCSNNSESNKGEVETTTVQDIKGEVKIPKNPKKIVDLSGNSDILSILGYSVIGTANSDAYDYTKFPTYLEDKLKDAKILGYSMQDSMDVEAVMNLEPDLIILSTVQEKMYDQLKEVAPTVMIKLEALNWKEDLNAFAKIFGKEDAAKEWITKYEEKASKVGEEIKKSKGEKTTYLSFLASGGQFFIFDKAGFGSVLYEDLKLIIPSGLPEQKDISLPVVTYEGLASIKSDYIFVIGTNDDLAQLEKNNIWKNIPEVKAGKVIKLPASPYFNQGYSSVGRDVLLDEITEMVNGSK